MRTYFQLRRHHCFSVVFISFIVLFLVTSGGIAQYAQHPHLPSLQPSSSSIDLPEPSLWSEVELKYYDEQPPLLWGGYTPGTTWQAAIRFTPAELYDYDGWCISKVKFFHWYDSGHQPCSHSGMIYVYDQGTIYEPGPVLTSQPFTADPDGWVEFTLSEPIQIIGTRDIWISFETTQDEAGTHYFGLGDPPGENQKSMWIYHLGEWLQLTDINDQWSFDWSISALIHNDGGDETTELAIAPIRGGLGVHAKIVNEGEYQATNIDWSISVTGGLFRQINATTTDYLSQIAVGDDVSISSDIIIGLGPITIDIYASGQNAGIVSEQKQGFLLGPYILCL